jgi:methylglutaconyl-CoA hydratase
MQSEPDRSGIRVEIDAGRIATVTLDRPEVHNVFNDTIIAGLSGTFAALAADDRARIVVLRASGKSFSAGADLGWMQRMADYSTDDNVADAMALAGMLHTLDTCPKPTVAMVQGPAYGGGVGLVAACDVAIASRAASFALSEVRLGLIPAVISPYLIAAIGERACRRYFLTAERFSAEEAHRLGLVHEVVAPEQLEAAVAAVVARLGEGGPHAQAEAKALIRAVARKPLDETLRRETAERIARQRAAAEAREGVSAFLQKRQPAWRS